jgi:hypothetical protein
MKYLLVQTLVAVMLISAVSCSGTPAPVAVHPVKGQVFYGEQPAAGVKVYFFPTSAPQMPEIPANPHGITGPDGRFTLTTYKDSDGAAEGGYLVILLWQPATKPNEESCNEDKLLGWYDAAHTKLTAHVKTGDNNLAPFRLPIRSTPPEASRGVPGRN